jgi:hypothetical protein
MHLLYQNLTPRVNPVCGCSAKNPSSHCQIGKEIYKDMERAIAGLSSNDDEEFTIALRATNILTTHWISHLWRT